MNQELILSIVLGVFPIINTLLVLVIMNRVTKAAKNINHNATKLSEIEATLLKIK